MEHRVINTDVPRIDNYIKRIPNVVPLCVTSGRSRRPPKTVDKMASEKYPEDLKHTQSIQDGTINDVSTAEALTLCRDADEIETSPELARALRWKLDLRLMPLLCFTYALQSIDKNTISYAAVFGLREDLNLKGNEFSWTGAIFYLGYLVWEFPTSIFLQRFPINYFMSGTVGPLSIVGVYLLRISRLLAGVLYSWLTEQSIRFPHW